MRKSKLYKFFSHHEKNLSLINPRHPLVFVGHVFFIVLLICIFGIWSDMNPGQMLYLAVTVGLYISSAMYHTFNPDSFLRVVDQTMISAYVMVIPMPFLYQRPHAFIIYFVLVIGMLIYKIFEGQKYLHRAGWIFMGIGAGSAILTATLGFDAIGQNLISWAGVLMVTSIVFFLLKLAIYESEKLNFIPGLWETPESGHSVLAIAVVLHSCLVINYPV